MIIPQLILESILLGLFYAFMSIGFSLTWGVLGILNLAYGSFILLGSYFSYVLFTSFGLDPLLGIPVSFITGFLFGAIIQKLFIDRIMLLEPFLVLIITFGLDIVIAHTLNLIFKADIRSIDVQYAEKSFFMGDLIVSLVKLVVAVISLFLVFLLYLFLKYTWTGRAIRAVALDKEGARLVGINPSGIYVLTMGIGTGIAFISGNLYGVLQGFTPFDGGILTIKAFLISIIGGLGRVESALLGGLFLGFLEIFVSFYLGESWKFFVSLILMILILIVRPRGLFGGKYYGES